MPQLDQDYVFLPQRLLADLRANPAAIGAYALIARLFLIYQEPIPLSAADLQRYDPALSYGAARGALQRLVALRWLREQSGHKNHYTPTWGVIKGTTLPWRMDAPTLGRPAHVVTLRLDRRLLDIGLGRLIPHATYPAQTHNRYLARPILSLRDVGAYAQVLVGQTLAATSALWRYGLMRDGIAQPIASAVELVARASQRTLEGDGAALTVQGLHLLGMDYATEQQTPSSSQTLFFVDHALIPDLIPPLISALIPSETESENPFSAVESPTLAPTEHTRVMQGNPGILSETSDSPPNPPTRAIGGGGDDRLAGKKSEQKEDQSETESSRLLRSIGAFPSSVEEFADFSAELVGRAIIYAEAEPGIASVPGWVVEALRRHRDQGWQIPEPRTKQLGMVGDDGLVDMSAYTGGAYGDLFRLGSDLSGLQEGVLAAPARTEEQIRGPHSPPGVSGKVFYGGSGPTGRDSSSSTQEGHTRKVPVLSAACSAYAEGCSGAHDRGSSKAPARVSAQLVCAEGGVCVQSSHPVPKLGARHVDAPDGAGGAQKRADLSSTTASNTALTQELRAELLAQCGRRYRPIISGLEIQTSPSATVLICANVSDMRVVQNELLGAIHGILARLGAPTQLVHTTRAGWQAR